MVSNTEMMVVLTHMTEHKFTITDVAVIVGVIIVSLAYVIISDVLKNRKEKK